MTQLTLPYQPHSPTSRAAAESMDDVMLNRLESVVFSAIKHAGIKGMTDLEGQVATGLDGSTYRPRRISLCEKKLIVPMGTRETKSKRQSVVWVAV